MHYVHAADFKPRKTKLLPLIIVVMKRNKAEEPGFSIANSSTVKSSELPKILTVMLFHVNPLHVVASLKFHIRR